MGILCATILCETPVKYLPLQVRKVSLGPCLPSCALSSTLLFILVPVALLATAAELEPEHRDVWMGPWIHISLESSQTGLLGLL